MVTDGNQIALDSILQGSDREFVPIGLDNISVTDRFHLRFGHVYTFPNTYVLDREALDPEWCVLIVVLKGRHRVEMPGFDETIERGQMIIVPHLLPGRLTTPCDGDYTGIHLRTYIEPGQSSPFHQKQPTCFLLPTVDAVEHALCGMFLSADEPGLGLSLRYFTESFLHLLNNAVKANSEEDEWYLNRLKSLWNLVRKDIAKPWDIPGLARESGMSPRQFYRMMERYYEISPSQYLTRLRMEAAMRQLSETDSSLDIIAETCGYSTPFSFSKAFCREVGCRPGEYRKQTKSP